MQYAHMGLIRSLKRVIRGNRPSLPEVDPRLARLERFYRCPPLTDDLTAAVRCIAPQCNFPPEEKYREAWEQYQNVCCWSEFEVLEPLFNSLPRPRRILEIGPGLGRSLVFFAQKLNWADADIHAYEGDGAVTKYTRLGPRFDNSFCGSIAALKKVLAHNGVLNVTIHDANMISLRTLPGPFDLVYSFYSIGFHWSLEHFIDDLLPLLSEEGTAVFTIPPDFRSFPQLELLHLARMPLFPGARKANRRYELLAIRKSSFPESL